MAVVREIGRFFHATVGLLALACAALLGLLPQDLSPITQAALLVAWLGYAAVCGLAWRLCERASFPAHAALFGISLGGLALAGAMSVLLGQGLRHPALGVGGLLVCMVCAVTTVRLGVALAAASVAGLVAVALFEVAGLGPTPAEPASLLFWLLLHVLLIAAGLAGGVLIVRMLDHGLRAAREREQRFQSLLAVAVDCYWEQDAQFRFTQVSDPLGAGSGIDPAERIGLTPWELDGMGLSDEQIDAHRADLESHLPFSGLLAQRTDAQGRLRVVSISGEPRFDAAGVFCGYWGVGRDVTTEVASRQSLLASETRYRELFERSPSPLLLHRRGTVIDANAAAARLFGFDNVAALTGMALLELFAPGDSRERAAQRLERLDAVPVGDGLPVTDFRMRARDGRFVSAQATGVRVDTGGGPAILSIFFDLTGRQSAEAALRRSEALLSQLFATSPDVITLTDATSDRCVMVNESFTRLTGYTVAEALGRSAAELGLWQSASDRERLAEVMRANGSVRDFPAVFVTKFGLPVSMLMSAGRFEMDGRQYLVINARDVTEVERARLEHETILQRASIGIALTRERRFVRVNPSFERMLGWPSGTLVGQPGSVVWPSEAAYDEIGRLAGPLLLSGKPVTMDQQLRRRDGSLFWCRVLAQMVDRSDAGDDGTIWIAEDVTERRETDRALTEARDAAEAASRAKSAFLAHTSHAIRTPLNALIGLARMALQPGIAPPRRQQYLLQIQESAQNLAGLLSDILDLSKIEAGKLTLDVSDFDLREALQASHRNHLALAEAKGLELLLEIDDSLPGRVRGDPLRMRQILSNFISNALKFTDQGRVRIQVSGLSGGRVRLAVRDSGAGIAADVVDGLFQPFVQADETSTRGQGGSGLGLSICRQLAELMGGQVGVDSRPGHGSLFWADLPLPANAAGHREPLPSPSPPGRDADALRGSHVLLVEDNPMNMTIGVSMLEQWGVRVTQALDGAVALEAVEVAIRGGIPFDAVLMDLHMPVMGGHMAVRALRERHTRERLPIIALTAAALSSQRDEALAAGMNDFLTKPIDSARLRDTLLRHITLARSAAPER